jgi:hypothetical protein
MQPETATYSGRQVPHKELADSNTRSSTTALVWRIGGIDWNLYYEWQKANREAAGALYMNISKIAGFRCAPIPGSQYDWAWINNWHADKDCSKIKDMTATEINTRNTMRDVLAYLKEACPLAFRNAYIYDIAPQLGCRCSRRLQGET